MRNSQLVMLLLGVLTLNSCASNSGNNSEMVSEPGFIKLPEGFVIEDYVDYVKNPREMVLGDKGTLFVGSKYAGNVYAILDNNHDRKADTVITIAERLEQPVGVAFRKGSLYVSAISKILRYDNIENRLSNPPEPVVVYNDFPDEEHHGWKFIAFGPDDKLYVPVGAPCNICLSKKDIFATITRMNPDGTGFEIYASGIRNTVGFDWHPVTKELWFSDNGRDWLGDDRPPDEINRAPAKGMNFGYPYCHGDDIADPKYGDLRDCSEFVKPVQKLGPHVAALGIQFYTGNMFPAEYKNQLFIAEHGSWNRSTKLGYRITMVKLDGTTSKGYEVFARGWEKDGKVYGRPVDLLILDDGSMLVSDDYGDKIYRIYYKH